MRGSYTPERSCPWPIRGLSWYRKVDQKESSSGQVVAALAAVDLGGAVVPLEPSGSAAGLPEVRVEKLVYQEVHTSLTGSRRKSQASTCSARLELTCRAAPTARAVGESGRWLDRTCSRRLTRPGSGRWRSRSLSAARAP